MNLLPDLPAETIEWIVALVALMVGFFGGRPLFQVIKEALNLQDGWALVMVYVVSLLIGALALWLSGALVAIVWSWENVVKIGLIFFAAAHAAYVRFKARQGL